MEKTMSAGVVGGAVLGWLGVGAYGIWEITGEEAAEGWERPYVLFSIALFCAAALTLTVAWSCSRDTGRPVARRLGLGFGVIAIASASVAWALPLWTALVAISVVALAAASPRDVRPGLAVIAAAQLVGMAVMFAAHIAEVGRQDSYGDYPVAFGLGLVVTAVLSAVGLAMVARATPDMASEQPSPVRHPSPATP